MNMCMSMFINAVEKIIYIPSCVVCRYIKAQKYVCCIHRGFLELVYVIQLSHYNK